MRIAGVKKNSFAEQAGLKPEDQIVGAGSKTIKENNRIPSSELLEELATIAIPNVGARSIVVEYRRLDEYGQLKLEPKEQMLQGGKKPFYADHAQKLLITFMSRTPAAMPIMHKNYLVSYQKNGPERIKKRL